MNPLDDDQRQITDVLIRYSTGIDRRDWLGFRTCFTDDVHADYRPTGCYDGIDALTDAMIVAHQDMGDTHHSLSNVVVQLDGDSAEVRSYVHAVLMVTPGDPANWIDVIGHYDDHFVKVADGWRIAQRRCVISRVLTAGSTPMTQEQLLSR